VERFLISSSPHLKKTEDVPTIMWRVNLALAPAGIWAMAWFGYRAFLVIFLCSITAMATEAICQMLKGVRVVRGEDESLMRWVWRWLTATVGDGSALVTGLLLAYVLPPTLPWYLPVLGSIVAIGLCKHAFGGLGYNIWNPALMARAFLLAGYAGLTVMSAWPVLADEAPIFVGDLDCTAECSEDPQGVSEATTLFDPKVENVDEWRAEREKQLKPIGALLLGQMGGCLGEVGFLWLMLGGLYLIWRGHVDWRVPGIYIGTVLVLGWIMPEKIQLIDGTAWSGWFAGNPVHHLFGGGLIIGAFFMATDMVTSPVTRRGLVIFAFGCGLLTAIIRLYGGYPEGVCYSIILMNTAVPLIDRFTRPRIYGAVETDENAA
jgi:H+/Na+-translocating ferredoxin:NAD+ oxidoreductase subunit D